MPQVAVLFDAVITPMSGGAVSRCGIHRVMGCAFPLQGRSDNADARAVPSGIILIASARGASGGLDSTAAGTPYGALAESSVFA